jgi:phosphate transport system permease protein
MPLNNALGGSIPFFADTPFGLDVFTAGIVLAIMIIPTISSISREVMKAVPNSQREAAYSLGATRWETVRVAIFPYARSGLVGAAILGLGRAVGETMLVAMIIGNAIGKAAIPTSLFAPSQTLSSLIANEFNESVTSLHTAALIGLGFVLLMLTLSINLGARLLVSRISGAPVGRENSKWQIRISYTNKPISGEKRRKKIVAGLILKQSLIRKTADRIATCLAISAVILAIIPLGSILVEVVGNGAPALSFNFLTQPPGAIGTSDGGIGPSIQGTLIVIGLASAIGAPIGVMTGIYLSEFSSNGRFAYTVRLINDILTGLPSIVIGIVGYVTVVLAIGSFSVWAGAFALSILMIPIIVRVTEETLRIVPDSIREAGYSLGIPKWKVTIFIVFKSAASGVLTGIVLGISRITGETAPLIMTILGTSLFFTNFVGPMDALPLRIWRLSSQPYESAHASGWGAALVLIIIVLSLSVGIRYFSSLRGLKHGSIVA